MRMRVFHYDPLYVGTHAVMISEITEEQAAEIQDWIVSANLRPQRVRWRAERRCLFAYFNAGDEKALLAYLAIVERAS